MISTAISITKYENEAALEERREEEEERWMTMMMTIMIVLRKQLAHITRGREGGPVAAYLLAKTQSILRKIRFPERQREAEEAARAGRVPISLSYLLPTTSSLASLAASVCD